ncbi:hypothetical protein G7Y89_g14933 [Cudoniella acicularis]|uniref:F-box domain-containing protein n=1 Tax=Cudoniella acicularis TaxID=354080 RepID=A0A8H4VQI1_9HELO|nr:hypothetical protein G7Y89_g14933 [Cudoniella acicularis]
MNPASAPVPVEEKQELGVIEMTGIHDKEIEVEFESQLEDEDENEAATVGEVKVRQPSVMESNFTAVETQLEWKGSFNITTLPDEVQLSIINLLRPSESVMLGLTCKKFYAMHKELYGKVTINMRRYRITDPKTWEMLVMYHLLKDWMGKEWYFDLKKGTFVRKARVYTQEKMLEEWRTGLKVELDGF